MSLDEIKRGLDELTPEDRQKVTAYLFHLRHVDDEEYQREIAERMADRDPTHWLSIDEFEHRLNEQDA